MFRGTIDIIIYYLRNTCVIVIWCNTTISLLKYYTSIQYTCGGHLGGLHTRVFCLRLKNVRHNIENLC